MSMDPREVRMSLRASLGSFAAFAGLLAGCAPDGLDSGGAESGTLDSGIGIRGPVPLPADVLEQLEEGQGVDVLVQLDDRAVEAEIARKRRPSDRAGDGPALVEERAAALAQVADRFVAALPAGVTAQRRYTHIPVMVLHLSDVPAALALALSPDIWSIEPDVAHEASLSQSLDLIGQPTAEADGFLGAGTSVAVLDTGADWTKSDLGSCTAVATPAATCRVVYAADFATSDSSRDDNGHGTNVSSIVAAVAPGADILALDVFRSDGYGYSSDILAAIDWVIAYQSTYDIASINMSLGSGSYTAACSGVFASGIASARAAGVSVAVASGNNGYTNAISSPACVAEAVSVGAVYDSNFGGIGWSGCSDTSTAADKVTCFSNSASFLDVLAPGAMITAGGYTMGGTSMAAPHVAGALAVLRGADADATVDEIEARLTDNGVSVTDTRNGLTFPRMDLPSSVSDCVTAVSGSSIYAGATGGSGSLTVTTSAGCDWTVTSDASWLTLSAPGGTDSGSVTWTAAANTGAARTGSLSLSGRTISALQAADAAPSGTVSVNAGATGTRTTAVTLTLDATDATGGVSTMCVSNTSSCTAWQAYAASLSWTLSSTAGTKTVYAWFRDSYSNTSGAKTDTITLDTTAPTNGTVTATGSSGQAALSWTGFADSGAGIASYTVVKAASSTAPSSCSGTSVWTGTDTTATVTGLSNGTTYAFRVCATDGAGNLSTGATTTVVPAPEYTAPTGTIVINAGVGWTNSRTSSVTLSASDASGVSYACLSNTATCATWFAMTTTKAWSLSSATGTVTVYGWFKDAYGNISTVTTDTIGMDATKPVNGTVTATGTDGAVALSWTGYSDASAGIASYTAVYGTSSPATCTAGTSAYAGTGTSTSISGLTNGTTYYVRVCATDGAGNLSAGSTTSFRVAPEYTAPTGSIVVNSDAIWTNSRTVSVAVSATDDTGVASMCLTTATSCTTYVTYAATGSVTLSTTAGTRTVYAYFKDTYGNVSSPVSDTIGYDGTAPTGGTLTATASGGQVALAWSGFTDATSGVASYKLVYAATTAPTSCSAGTVAYEGTGTSATVTGLTNGLTYGFRACGVDTAGNTSTGVSTTARPATEYDLPTGTLTVNAGAAMTNSRTLSLAITGDDASGVAWMCVSTASTCTSWVAYATTATLTTATGDGTKTARVWLEDAQGNRMTTALSDTITLDATAPANGTVTATATSGGADVTWTGYSDAGSGLASYTLVYATGRVPTTCATGTVGYSGTTAAASLTGLVSGTVYYTRVCGVDALGTVGTGATRSFTAL
jgi:hypothetical protein